MDQELKGILTQILHRLDGQDAKMDAMDAKWEKKFDMVVTEIAMIKEDITDIRATMATKDDIAKIWDTMATKDDIAKIWDTMATKEDVAEIKQEVSEIKQEVSEIKQEVVEIKQEMGVMNGKIDLLRLTVSQHEHEILSSSGKIRSFRK